jgi:hypothetical protein
MLSSRAGAQLCGAVCERDRERDASDAGDHGFNFAHIKAA